MKGLKTVARQSKNIQQGNLSSWLPLYYSIKENKVSTTGEPGYYFITQLVRKCTEEEIKKAVENNLAM